MKKDFYEFYNIIKRLRAPNGCPWDIAQTHKSLAKHLIEEAYEAYDAIMDKDNHHTMDELGDVLLQIAMHACIAEECGEYTIDDITDNVSQKMITRHPHIFAEAEANTPQEVLDNWEEIKRRERGQKKLSESIEDVTRSLPALSRSAKIIKKVEKAQKLPEYQKNVLPEDFEIADGDALGQCLFEICAIANRKNLDPEAELTHFLKNFTKNLKNIEENT